MKIARSENLPVLPQIVSAVLKLADDPMASPKTMEAIIVKDPAISAKILRVANSAFYGGQNAATIARAISMLGMQSVRSLVIAVAYQQVIATRSSSQHFNRKALWRHSLATATAGRIIAKLTMPQKSEEIYAAAMMHDVGLLAMDKFCATELDLAVKLAKEEESPLHLAEQEVFGFDHAKVAGVLAEAWGFSPLLKNAVLYHHDPYEDDDHRDTTAVITLANALAYECGCPNQTNYAANTVDEDLTKLVGLNPAQYDAIRTVVECEVQKAEASFTM